ncbi:DUF4474 domain-containing protein [Solirubrobacter phytolaccae]|uniref:DUF4474 domain-containing protein n=1 Tax=Solirubrobacter phytolaccae TaxID=1404360 RepID=A0A9X3N5E7_9ACTN|nr:DUF4474 domain-containing protein [Solirubrobacter phytolaccae]MDA0178785.1 DUF4474 domain-containing protein [Solirubrobacter phytolaccae]
MSEWKPSTVLGGAVWAAGFTYDPEQDIIYSRMDALQRKFGYAWGYDNAALGMSAVIDCEPIFFDHGGKHWMIELWKGQYGLETGCEVGVYSRAINSAPNVGYQLLDATVGRRPGDDDPAHNLFYDCASDDDRLLIELTLYRNGERLFSRGPERHWWLTGFKWGVLSRPEELAVDIRIGFPGREMREAFEQALRARGHTDLTVDGDTVAFRFEQAFAPQPRAAVPQLVELAMQANQRIVERYRSLGAASNDPNQVQAEFLLFGGLGLLRAADVYGRLATQAGLELGHAAREVIDDLARFFGVATQVAREWFAAAREELSSWLTSVQRDLGLAMDYACVVEIDNREGPSDLLLERADAEAGTYAIAPPQWIPKGDVGRFVMQDTKLQPTGSGGSVRYRHCLNGMQVRDASLAYSCPFGFWTSNVVSVSGQFVVRVKTGNGEWRESTPRSGHPLYVKFVAVA